MRGRFTDQQETLYTLAADTGGKALLDENDLTVGIRQAQRDISSYYILGYYSANPAQDGAWRRIRVRLVPQPQARLDYRSGYFAPKEFRKFDAADRERQLEDALPLAARVESGSGMPEPYNDVGTRGLDRDRVRDPGARRLELSVPLASLKPGRYTVQLTVVDEIGKKFAFPRASIVVLERRPEPARAAS